MRNTEANPCVEGPMICRVVDGFLLPRNTIVRFHPGLMHGFGNKRKDVTDRTERV